VPKCPSVTSGGREYSSLNTVASWSLAPGHGHVWQAHTLGADRQAEGEGEREKERVCKTQI